MDLVDVDGGRVRVFVNTDELLKFKRRAGYANGDVINVTLTYEDLHRYCFTCKRISHEEGTCPELTEIQREKNKLARLEQKELEEKVTREAFSLASRYGTERTRVSDRNSPPTSRYEDDDVRAPRRSNSGEEPYFRNDSYQRSDLREKIYERRDHRSKNVWNRLDKPHDSHYPRVRERCHPYQKQRTLVYKAKEDDRERSGTNSVPPHPSSNHRHNREWAADSQSGIHFSSQRRSSPDSQRTVSANYETLRDRRYDREQGWHMQQRTHTEWRPIKDKPEGESRKDTTTLVPETFETEEERKRKLKGKAIATDTSLKKSRPLLSNGKLVIREQGKENDGDQTLRKSPVLPDTSSNRQTPKAHETSATENLKDVTGKAVAGRLSRNFCSRG